MTESTEPTEAEILDRIRDEFAPVVGWRTDAAATGFTDGYAYADSDGFVGHHYALPTLAFAMAKEAIDRGLEIAIDLDPGVNAPLVCAVVERKVRTLGIGVLERVGYAEQHETYNPALALATACLQAIPAMKEHDCG